MKTLTGHEREKILFIQLDKSRLVSSGEEKIRVWDINNYQCELTTSNDAQVTSLQFQKIRLVVGATNKSTGEHALKIFIIHLLEDY